MKPKGWGQQGGARPTVFLRAVAVLAAMLLVTAPSECRSAQEAEMEEFVKNGDFSQVEEGKPAGWVTIGDPEYVTQELVTADEGGDPCAKLVCTRCEGGQRRQYAVLAQVGQLRLEEGRLYELACRMRAEAMDELTVRVSIGDAERRRSSGLRVDLPVTGSWSEYRLPFAAARAIGETGRLQFAIAEPATLYLDDVRLVAIDPDQIVFTHVVPPGSGKNLLPNGSFELGKIGWSAVGRDIAWGNLDRLHGRVERSGGADGRRFLRIPLGAREGPTFYWDYYEPVVRTLRMMLAANLGWIRVDPGQPYTLSCDMRASVPGVTAVLGVRAQDPRGAGTPRAQDLRHEVRLTSEWQRYSFTFRPQRRYVFVTVGPDLDEETAVMVDLDAIQLEAGTQATAFAPHGLVEVGIEPSEPGGIFTKGKPATLKLRAYNSGIETASVHASFEVTDFFDSRAELPGASLEVPPGSLAEHDIVLPRDWQGYYRVQAVYDGEDMVSAQSLRIAIVPPQTEADSILGINHAFPDPLLIQVSKKAGVTWYRDWSLKWHDLEPAPGEYRWEIGDAQVDRVVEEGVHLMALMPPYPSAPWNTTGTPEVASERMPRELAWAPDDPQRLGDFIEKAVSHYRDRVQVWEFLNEPIYTHYALPARGGDYTPADYVALLKVAYAAMHRADPDCTVIAGIGSSPRRLTREVIEAGCLEHCDAFVLHLYPGRMPPEGFIEETDTLLRNMEQHGRLTPIWVTEFAYYGDDDPPSRPYVPGESWAEARLLADERQCVDYTIRLFALMMARGTEKFFFHAGVGGEVNQPYYDCSYLKYGGTPAKLFPALAVYADLLQGDWRFAREKRLGEDGFCVAFETDRQSVVVLWQARGQAAATVPADVACLDIVGRTLTERPLTLSSTPVYLVGPPGEAGRLVDAVRLASQ